MSVLKRSKPQMIAVQARMAVLEPRCPGTLLLVSLQRASKMNRRHAIRASKEAYTGVRPHPAAIGQPQRSPKPQRRRADWQLCRP